MSVKVWRLPAYRTVLVPIVLPCVYVVPSVGALVIEAVLLRITTWLKSASAELVQFKTTCALPGITLPHVAFAGDALSMVIVALPESVYVFVFVLVIAVTVPVTAYVDPGGTGIFAWVLGVIRTLYCVEVVVAVMFVPSVMATVSDAGFVTEPYTVLPASFVIATRLNPAAEPADNDTVTPVTVSVPDDV